RPGAGRRPGRRRLRLDGRAAAVLAQNGVTVANIVDIVRRGAKERPAAPMLSYQGGTISWAEHDERTNRVANGLAAAGVGNQDRIAFVDKNGPAYFEVLFGGAKINAVN